MSEKNSLLDSLKSGREDARRHKDLEEARKWGIVPAEKDAEGNDINPHIPQFISKAPWYITDSNAPSLKHQRHKEEDRDELDLWYERGKIATSNASTYRKGACANCGAQTHQANDCLERPRKKGAKFTNQLIAADERILPALSLGYDSKRDRWAGYDVTQYNQVIHDYHLADIERKRRKSQQVHKKTKRESESDSEDEDSDDEEEKVGDFDVSSAPMGSKDDRVRTTTRDLRIREDTAKYLFNLDTLSAHYDPKTRSMRANPLPDETAQQQTLFRGDNQPRTSGDALKVKQMESFAWDAYTHGASVHFNALPTQLELMHRNHLETKNELIVEKKQGLVEKYGGKEHMELPPEIRHFQSEQYIEYAKDGTVAKSGVRNMAKSKYEEDNFLGNHTTVWGSFWDSATKSWGFKCCGQTQLGSSCTL